VTLSRGRVLKAPENAAVLALGHDAEGAPRGRRVPHAELEAAERAEAVIDAATRRGTAILADAERRAAEAHDHAVEAGRAEGVATAAALALTLREREARADDLALDRVVELSRLLAERLLGHTLRVNPDEVTALARGVLAEAGGARRIELYAHPDDVPLLRGATASFDPEGRVHAVIADDSLARGDLRLNTEMGMIDARLGPELSRLSQRLRDALAP
jgi:flagellar biosynthesis/type III secretory pathway protein FliH